VRAALGLPLWLAALILVATLALAAGGLLARSLRRVTQTAGRRPAVST
jgi:hypothetical protein